MEKSPKQTELQTLKQRKKTNFYMGLIVGRWSKPDLIYFLRN